MPKFSGRLLWLPTLLATATILFGRDSGAQPHASDKVEFRTSDRCVACHNGLKTGSGEDVSIGFEWRASIMANSSRDPYWQGSVRREAIDHPELQAVIEDECSSCHMPIVHLTARDAGRKAEVFAHLPFSASHQSGDPAADGVSCSVCHQVERTGLGTRETFNGEVKIDALNSNRDNRPEYGPFNIDHGHQRVMQSSTAGFVPVESDHIRDSALCGSCHTLYTKARGPVGSESGTFPEQMPYLEWLHSDYRTSRTCQSCHMPEVHEAVPITALYGQPREGLHRHEFVGANFLMEGMLNDHHDELGVQALPDELSAARAQIIKFLQTETARLSIPAISVSADALSIQVLIENLTGHKFPTAYPSRRAWIHVVVRDGAGRTIFESGALNPDGSIVGNDNDIDPLRFEPHYQEISDPQQVEIFEPILKDSQGKVTTGLLDAVGYLKDNRILPAGFDKQTASNDIAVVGSGLSDPNFTDHGSLTRYRVNTNHAAGPFHVEAELWYQPVGFRWAHNLGNYEAAESQRFVSYYKAAAGQSAICIGKAELTR